MYSSSKKKKVSAIVSNLIRIICALLTLLVIYTSFDQYLNSPTTIVVDMKPMSELMFPQFTVCPTLEILSKHPQMNLSDWPSFYNSTLNPDELLNIIKIDSSKRIERQEAEFQAMIQGKLSRLYGRCVTVTIPSHYVHQGLDFLSFYSQTEFVISAHSPNAFFHSIPTAMQSQKGAILYSALTYNVKEKIEGNQCSFAHQDNYDQAFHEILESLMMEKFGCVAFDVGNEQLPLCNSTLEFFNRRIEVSKHLKPPCKSIVASVGSPFIGKGINSSQGLFLGGVSFRFEPIVTKEKLVYAYDAISMVADIGGYSSLLLGISVIDISRLIQKLLRF